jgi:hypothetical protein
VEGTKMKTEQFERDFLRPEGLCSISTICTSESKILRNRKILSIDVDVDFSNGYNDSIQLASFDAWDEEPQADENASSVIVELDKSIEEAKAELVSIAIIQKHLGMAEEAILKAITDLKKLKGE